MRYRKKPIVVDVRGPITAAETVRTANGDVVAQPGCFILTDPGTGDTWPVTPDIFAETYEFFAPATTTPDRNTPPGNLKFNNRLVA